MASPAIFFFVLTKQKPMKGSCVDGESWAQEMGFITNPEGINKASRELFFF